jgi:hypothetical protein
MSEEKFCKVYGCRFAFSHTTPGHNCGKCKKYCHGNYECSKPHEIQALIKYAHDKMPLNKQCLIKNCQFVWSHSTAAHNCRGCGDCHNFDDCPNNPKNIEEKEEKEEKVIYIIECPICRTKNIILEGQKKLFGIDDICKVCMENKVDIFLPSCGHACLCGECVDKMNTVGNDL